MNKLFKGAIAGAAGVALLLGGAGTFALWNDAADVGTDAVIDAGHLRFGNVPAGEWYVNGDDENPLTDEQISAMAVVPGEILEYKVDGVEVVAHGDNLLAELGVDWDGVTAVANDGHELTHAQASAMLKDAFDVGYTVDGVATDTIAVEGSTEMTTQTHDIVVRMTFDPTTEDQDAMGGRIDLDGFELTLKQVPAAGHAEVPAEVTE